MPDKPCHANVAAAISQKLYIAAIFATDPVASKVHQKQGAPGIQPSSGLMSPPLSNINGKIQARERLACNSHEYMSPPQQESGQTAIPQLFSASSL